MAPRITWEWRPTEAQRKLFEEWRKLTIGSLVCSREGVNIRSMPNFLEESVYENIPLDKMGFRTINQFIYEISDCVETRTLHGKYFVFIREAAVPDNMRDIRQLVLGQAKDNGCKTKTGVIKRPTRAQSSYCRPEELLVPIQHVISRSGPILGYQRPVLVSSGVSNMRRPGAPMNSGIRQNPGTGGQGRPAPTISSRPNPAISSKPTPTAPSKPAPTLSSGPAPTVLSQPTSMANSSIPPRPTLTAISSPTSTMPSQPTSTATRKPLRGITLDTDCVLNQYIPNLMMHDHVVRMAEEMPMIKFPPFFRGGSLKANFSLKQYLAEVNGSACA